jgi:hypothetical protein
MDPNYTIALLNDPETNGREFVEAMDSLDSWLARGGFAPTERLTSAAISRSFFFFRDEAAARIERAIENAERDKMMELFHFWTSFFLPKEYDEDTHTLDRIGEALDKVRDWSTSPVASLAPHAVAEYHSRSAALAEAHRDGGPAAHRDLYETMPPLFRAECDLETDMDILWGWASRETLIEPDGPYDYDDTDAIDDAYRIETEGAYLSARYSFERVRKIHRQIGSLPV